MRLIKRVMSKFDGATKLSLSNRPGSGDDGTARFTEDKLVRPSQRLTAFERFFNIDKTWAVSPWRIEPRFSSLHARTHEGHLEQLVWMFPGIYPDLKEQMRRGTVALVAGKPDQAEAALAKAVGQEPYLGPLRFLLGEAYRMQGLPAKARPMLRAGTQSWSSCATYVSLALIEWHFKNWEEANENIEAACGYGNVHPIPYFVQGLIQAAQSRAEDSLESLKEARRLSAPVSFAAIDDVASLVQQAISSGTADRVDCGIDPLKILTCVTM